MPPSPSPTVPAPLRASALPRVILGLAAVVACADAGAGERPARRDVPIETAEWERDIGEDVAYPISAVALRAGAGLAAVLHDPPLGYRLYFMAEPRRRGSGGPRLDRPPVDTLWGMGRPSDVVGVHADSVGAPADAWFLDPARGRVIGVNVGGHVKTIAGFGTRGTVRTACALGARAIAYLDDARPDSVIVRGLHPPHAVRAYAFPAGLSGRGVRWSDLRFGGSEDGPCVLHAPRMRGVAVVTDTAVHPVAPFVEPLSRVDSLYAAEAWYAWLADLVTRDGEREGAIDATSWHGGAAVLFGGSTPDAGRVVDFYDARGAYVTSMRLPHRALRIAATRHRLVVLRQRHGKVLLSSYVLPEEVRRGAVEPEAQVLAPDRSHHLDARSDSGAR